MTKEGMVYLAGAGPGDPELITLKVLSVLEDADCVIYDFLANPVMLDSLKCEKIYVGKQGGDHTLPQEEINMLLVAKAREGKTVVRLKGGDPFIFGRGGEEAEALLEHGIKFRIIPGISSFYSAPAYAGIPVTHRDYANAFEVITGHRRSDSSNDEDVNFPDYDDSKTFVFLMGMKNIGHISDKLTLEKKFPVDTPVGVISWGTMPNQRVVTGTLKNIAQAVAAAKLRPPAIIIVGKVVLLRDKLRWYDTLPLFGKKIVVTRTREQASKLSKKLLRLGAQVVEFPTIEIRPRADLSGLDDAIRRMEEFEWIVFTSQNAVDIFFKRLFGSGKDARSLHNIKIAAIGPATASEIKTYSITPDLLPEKYVAEAVVEAFKNTGVQGKRILLPCASEARDTLRDGFASLGAMVERIHIYDTVVPAVLPDDLISEVRSADIITFTSSSTVRNFFSMVSGTEAHNACIGPVTAAAVRGLGLTVHVEAEEYTIDGLVDALVRWSAKSGDQVIG